MVTELIPIVQRMILEKTEKEAKQIQEIEEKFTKQFSWWFEEISSFTSWYMFLTSNFGFNCLIYIIYGNKYFNIIIYNNNNLFSTI